MKILFYGAEKVGRFGGDSIKNKNFEVQFEPYNTQCRFQEFDGVILFQGIFESFKWEHPAYGNSYLTHRYDADELDKRYKELSVLLKKGGFACFLLNQDFIDRTDSVDCRGTDLAKKVLNIKSLFRANYASRATRLRVVRDEFLRFLDLYGAASSYFTIGASEVEAREIAKNGSHIVSMILADRLFFIPCLNPSVEKFDEFVRFLVDALVSTRKKLQVSIPNWLKTYQFTQEVEGISQKDRLIEDLNSVNTRLAEFEKYKQCLMSYSDLLVEHVQYVLEKGFGFRVDSFDEYREDLKLMSEDGSDVTALIEVKGTNKGVKREHVNQADSHRERAELDPDFPCLLIMNTHIKDTKTLDTKKDAEPDVEQILHAFKNNVLIIRTWDLLELLKIYLDEGLSREEVLHIFQKSGGWLRIRDSTLKIVTGDTGDSPNASSAGATQTQ